MPPEPPNVTVATRPDEVARTAERLAREPRIAFDLESNGLFAYRAHVCAVQLGAGRDVFVIDALATSLEPLAELLSERGPVKVVHDVAFDARMLGETGIALGNCHDTSLAARMLGRTATGLASLLAAELGVTVDKAMQSHDWGRRPFDAEALVYLASDVIHLEALDDALWGAVLRAQIEAEVLEETRYRLDSAMASVREPDTRPAFARIKGVERVPAADLPVLRRIAALREREAMRLDVPPYKVLGSDVLLAIAAAKPKSIAELRRIRGATQGPRAGAMADQMLAAVRQGLADGPLPEEERAALDRPRVSPSVAKTRRAREMRLIAWRREVAKARGVDEQVVMPGHCVKDAAGSNATTLDELAKIAGLGAFRVARDGEAILRTLEGASLG